MKWGLWWFPLVDLGVPRPRPKRQFTEESGTEKDEQKPSPNEFRGQRAGKSANAGRTSSGQTSLAQTDGSPLKAGRFTHLPRDFFLVGLALPVVGLTAGALGSFFLAMIHPFLRF
jgi:hypothetical protein